MLCILGCWAMHKLLFLFVYFAMEPLFFLPATITVQSTHSHIASNGEVRIRAVQAGAVDDRAPAAGNAVLSSFWPIRALPCANERAARRFTLPRRSFLLSWARPRTFGCMPMACHEHAMNRHLPTQPTLLPSVAHHDGRFGPSSIICTEGPGT